jgi:hypothetical protein
MLKLQSRWQPDFKFSSKLDLSFPAKGEKGRGV